MGRVVSSNRGVLMLSLMQLQSAWAETRLYMRERWPALQVPSQPLPAFELGVGLERRAEWVLTRLALAREPEAQQIIDAWVGRLLGAWFQRHGYPSHLRDDARQEVRSALFGVESTGELAQYLASGPLDRWLQVTAIRRSLNVLRSLKRSHLNENLDEVDERHLGTVLDPHWALLAQDQRVAFKAAFEAALQKLEDRDRMLLSMRYLHGASVDRLAGLVGAHRVSVSRWLAQARKSVLHEVRKELACHSTDGSFELSEWMNSKANLSLSRLFRLNR